MADQAIVTREALIRDYVTSIRNVEGKGAGEIDRAYLLDLVAEVVAAIDGARKRPLSVATSGAKPNPRPKLAGES